MEGGSTSVGSGALLQDFGAIIIVLFHFSLELDLKLQESKAEENCMCLGRSFHRLTSSDLPFTGVELTFWVLFPQ